MEARQHVRWHSDDREEWFGWSATQDMSTDDPMFLVKSPEPGIWAGWQFEEDGSRQCITNDFQTTDAAMRAVEGR